MLQNALSAFVNETESKIPFSAKRQTEAGTPSLWKESIATERGEQQSYVRLRSPADEGGAPIGIWHAPADELAIKELAKALQSSPFFTLQNDAVEPGEEYTVWTFKIGDAEQSLCAVAGSAVLREMSPLDLLFRRLANRLVQSKQGVALLCELDLNSGQPSLLNEGSQAGIIINSFYDKMTETDFFRVEVGPAVQEIPGVTGIGIEYKPIPMSLPSFFKAPFDQQYIRVQPGERLKLPVQLSLDPYKGHYVRAVYSNYSDAPQSLDYPIVRGRVFSIESKI